MMSDEKFGYAIARTLQNEGGNVGIGSGVTVPANQLVIGGDNTITAGTIGIGNGGKSIKPELHLGSATNTLNAGLVRIGLGDSGGRESGKLVFESGTGAVQIRGSAGGSTRANLSILVGVTGAGGSSNSCRV